MSRLATLNDMQTIYSLSDATDLHDAVLMQEWVEHKAQQMARQK